MSKRNIVYLHELSDYKVASGYSDVRGWSVQDKVGKIIGKVDNLVVNKSTKRVVYLDVEVNTSSVEWEEPLSVPASKGAHGFINKEGDNHLLIPIGTVALNEDQQIIQSSEIDEETFSKAPRFKKGEDIKEEYELMIYKLYVPDATYEKTGLNDNFYNGKLFQY